LVPALLIPPDIATSSPSLSILINSNNSCIYLKFFQVVSFLLVLRTEFVSILRVTALDLSLTSVETRNFLNSTKHYAMKTYGGVEIKAKAFLTSALGGDERSASCSGYFTTRERDSGTHWLLGCMGSRTGLDAVVKRQIYCPRLRLEPDSSVVQQVAKTLYRLSYPAYYDR
jgi:hypothetical protein